MIIVGGTYENGDSCTINPRDPGEVTGAAKMLRVYSGDEINFTLNNNMDPLSNSD